MATILPTLTDGTQAYSFRTQLDGVTFQLDFAWNARGGCWSIMVSDAAGNLLLRRCVRVGLSLLARFRDTRLPPGDIVVVDTSGAGAEPGLTDLGGRVQLVYLTAAEIAA